MDFYILMMPGLALTLVRMTSMISSMIFLGQTGETRMVRLTLAVGLSVIIFLRDPVIIDADSNLLSFGVTVAQEVVLGVAMGFSLQTVFTVLRVAGSILGQEMGFNLSQVMDPISGMSSPVMGRFFESLCYLFLLSVNGHHRILLILSETFYRIPVGGNFDVIALGNGLTKLTANALKLGFSLAFPVYGALLLVSTTLMVMARAVPQVHLMEFAFALRILVALIVMTWFMGSAAPFIFHIFDSIFTSTHEILIEMSRGG